MTTRNDVDSLTVAELRADPMLAPAIYLAIQHAERVGEARVVPREDGATLQQLIRWARGRYADADEAEPRDVNYLAALYRLLSVLGEDLSEMPTSHDTADVVAAVRASLLTLNSCPRCNEVVVQSSAVSGLAPATGYGDPGPGSTKWGELTCLICREILLYRVECAAGECEKRSESSRRLKAELERVVGVVDDPRGDFAAYVFLPGPRMALGAGRLRATRDDAEADARGLIDALIVALDGFLTEPKGAPEGKQTEQGPPSCPAGAAVLSGVGERPQGSRTCTCPKPGDDATLCASVHFQSLLESPADAARIAERAPCRCACHGAEGGGA